MALLMNMQIRLTLHMTPVNDVDDDLTMMRFCEIQGDLPS